MPLSFQTVNQGDIAFGFFNIESDMLLLQRYFFFADAFCAYVSDCAEQEKWEPEGRFKVYEIADPTDIGDLMGAIHGIRYTGFIGETYRRFPFPDDPDHFKQNPKGFMTQDIIKNMIEPFANITEIQFILQENRSVSIGDYTFDQITFHKLLQYVEQGGYPRWQNEIRPDYIKVMQIQIAKSTNDMFDGLKFN